MSNKPLSLLVSGLFVAALGCSGDDTPSNNNTTNNNTNNNTSNNNTGNNNNTNNSGLSCPQSASLTVCDLKLDGGAQQPQLGDPVVLEEVVVTSPVFTIIPAREDSAALLGFFVQDLVSTDDLGGRFSGIQVTYREDAITMNLPSVGDVIRIEGTFRDFGQDGGLRQKQLSATFFGASTRTEAVTPIAVGDASTIATGGTRADDYDGVLIQISNVSATVVRDVPGSGGSNIFGAFMVDGGLVISGTLYETPRVQMGEMFTSITGVLRIGTAPFDSGISLFTPRSADDVVRATPLDVTTRIQDLQDDSAPNHPSVCTNMGGEPVGTCPLVDFDGVVVTAVDSFVSTNLRGLWVQDPNSTDGRFAGVKIIYSANDQNVPAVGNIVNVSGEAVDFFGSRQVQFADIEIVDASTSSVAPFVVSGTDIARDSGASNPFEGVLVQVQNTQVTQACVEAGNGRDFGNFLLTGNVFVGNAFNYDYNGMGVSSTMCETVDCSCAGMSREGDMRAIDDMFTSVTGVMNFSFDDLRLEPRSNDDLAR